MSAKASGVPMPYTCRLPCSSQTTSPFSRSTLSMRALGPPQRGDEFVERRAKIPGHIREFFRNTPHGDGREPDGGRAFFGGESARNARGDHFQDLAVRRVFSRRQVVDPPLA